MIQKIISLYLRIKELKNIITKRYKTEKECIDEIQEINIKKFKINNYVKKTVDNIMNQN